MAAGNLGFASHAGAVRLPISFILIAAGTLFALANQLIRPLDRPVRTETPLRAIAPGLASILVVLYWGSNFTNRWIDLISIPVFAWAIAISTMRAAIATRSGGESGRWRSAAALTLGLLAQTGFVFFYFARSGPILFMLAPVALLALAPVIGPRSSKTGILHPVVLTRVLAIVMLVSLVAASWLFLDETNPGTNSVSSGTLTVMSFNIQEGFSNEVHWSLETTARTIEAQNPDIVFLQEITRGWLVMSSVDEVRWLADRLNMHYAYAGNSYDGLWGNAILSRFPIVSERSTIFPVTDNLRRGAVAIEIDTGNHNLLLIDTHLDNPLKATPIRLEQIHSLLGFWGNAEPAIIAGDFNADPGSPEWQAMIDAGFVDSAGNDKATTSEDNRRIDYIWITPDLRIETYEIPDAWASDHRPVVVSFALPA